MHCDWLCQLDRSLVEKRLRHVDGVVTVSGFLADRRGHAFPIGRQIFRRSTTAWTSPDFHRLCREPARARVRVGYLYVGRHSPEKGVHILLQAFSIISAEFPDARLDLVGPESVLSREFVDPDRQDPILEKMSNYFENRGSYVPWLRSIVRPEAADRVRFLGSLSHDDLPGYYRASDVLVVPSIFDEPFGLPIAEGLASGLPVIATRAGAFAEIVEDGESGILVDRDNASQLAGAIGRSFPTRMVQKRCAWPRDSSAESMFSWDDLAHRLRNRYEAIGNIAAAPDRPQSEMSAA